MNWAQTGIVVLFIVLGIACVAAGMVRLGQAAVLRSSAWMHEAVVYFIAAVVCGGLVAICI